MRIRSKILMTMGIACLSASALAGGALAHGSKGKADLKVEIRGAVVSNADGKITIDPGTPPPWTCTVPVEMQAKVADIVATDQVKAKCRDKNGVLTLTRIREKGGNHGQENKGEHKSMHKGGQSGRVEVEARGTVTKVGLPDATTGNMDVTVQPGPVVGLLPATGNLLPAVTCTVTERTHVFGTPTVGDSVKIKCKSRGGVLVAKKIKEKGLIKPGQVQVEVKAPSAVVVGTMITIGPVSCVVPTGSTLLNPPLDLTKPVEAHCAGDPLTLVSIHQED